MDGAGVRRACESAYRRRRLDAIGGRPRREVAEGDGLAVEEEAAEVRDAPTDGGEAERLRLLAALLGRRREGVGPLLIPTTAGGAVVKVAADFAPRRRRRPPRGGGECGELVRRDGAAEERVRLARDLGRVDHDFGRPELREEGAQARVVLVVDALAERERRRLRIHIADAWGENALRLVVAGMPGRGCGGGHLSVDVAHPDRARLDVLRHREQVGGVDVCVRRRPLRQHLAEFAADGALLLDALRLRVVARLRADVGVAG